MKRRLNSKIAPIAVYAFASLVLILSFQNCTPGFQYDSSASLSSVVDDSNGDTAAELAKISKGRDLYATNCESCHAQIDNSDKRIISVASLSRAIDSQSQMKFLKTISPEDRSLIVLALTKSGNLNEEILGTPVIAKTWETLAPKSCSKDGASKDIAVLTPIQYANIIADTFGFAVNTSALPAESRDYYTPSASSGGVGLRDVSQLETYYKTAVAVSTSLDNDFDNVTKKFSACVQSASACQTEITLKVLSRLFREKLSGTEAEVVAITDKFKAETDFKTRLTNSVVAALMSPRFLYVVEFQAGFRTTPLLVNKLRTLTDVEVASRLSFLIWNSSPDEELLNLAAAKTLSQPAVLKAQLARLLANSKSDRFVKTFTGDWLNITGLNQTSKDAGLVPGFSQSLMGKMKTETEMFSLSNFRSGVDIRQLFTSDKTFVDSALATHYGIAGVSGTNFVEVRKPASDLQAGLLSQGSLSAATAGDATDPIHRGLYLYSRFLCGRIPDPPASASLVAFEGSKFEQMLQRGQNQSCAGCHAKFESLGYVLEVLDPVGRFRTTDEAGAMTGRTVAMENGTPVTSVRDLSQALSSDPLTGFCLMRNLEKYALSGSFASTKGLQCQTENQLYQAYRNGNSFKSYVESVVLSPLFVQKMETY